MPFLGTTPTQGFVGANPKQSFTANGSTTVFTLTHPVANANDLEVFVGNVRQEPTAAYTAAGTTLTMSEAPATGLNFYVINKSQAQVTTTPPVNSISTDKIVNNAVTVGKLATSGTLPALNGSAITHTGGLKSTQVFSSSGTHTYTKPTGIRTVKVTVTGAGGGGGGYGASGDRGAGGGAGGTAIETIDVSSVSTVTVNVGAGGAGGAAGNNNGAGGGGSSFGSYCTGNGGVGGKYGNIGPAVGGDGGTATGGDINIIGGQGNNGIDNGYVASGTNYTSSYGIGGASFWGGGGRGGSFNVAAHVGEAYGSGGGGGSNSNSGPGAAGQIGLVVVEEFA